MLQTLFGMNGRLTRVGFWEVLISVLLLDVAAGVAAITALEHAFPDGRISTASSIYEAVRWGLLAIAALSLWAIAAAHVKRAHDLGRGAATLLWVLVPVIGWFWLMFELGFQPGQNFRNRFGGQPLGHHDHGDDHQAGERELVPVGHDRPRGHGLLSVFQGHHDDTPPPKAELDWTGDASEASAKAFSHYHGRYDAGEALMSASEHHDAPPPPAPPPSAPEAPLAHPADDHWPADLSTTPSSASGAGHDDLSAALGDARRHP